MKNITIFVGSENKGLNISIGYVLAEEYLYNVTFIVNNLYAEKEVKSIYKDANILNFSSIDVSVNEDSVMEVALSIEKEYGINISSIMASNRDIGRGYLVNIERFPGMGRSRWRYKKKLVYIVSEILKWIKVLDGQEVYIQKWIDRIPLFIANTKNIRTFSLVPVKYGDRFMWSDDGYNSSTDFIKSIKDNLSNSKFIDSSELSYDFVPEGTTKMLNSKAKYTYGYAFRHAYYLALNEIKKILLGTKDKSGYDYFSWIPTAFNSVYNYKYLKKIGTTIEELRDYKLVYFPLHLEPEQSLLNLSPEFGNITEAIHLVSKNLPCNYVLVLKEQPFCFAVRGNSFYKQVSQIGNVYIANPEVKSQEWLHAADFIIAITGTVGIEAVYEEKPVISFGMHQIINNLPSVFQVSNFSEVGSAIDKITSGIVDNNTLSLSKKSLKNAQHQVSFDLSDYKNKIKSSSLSIDSAKKVVEHLINNQTDSFY